MLSCADLLKICMSESTTTKIWTDPDEVSHILRFVYPWPETPSGEIVVLMAYSKTRKKVRVVYDDIIRAVELCKGNDACIIHVDGYDFRQFTPLIDVVMIADGCVCPLLTTISQNGMGRAYFCCVVGQGFNLDYDEDGFFAVVTKILANYLPENPKDKILTCAKRDLETAFREMKEAGAAVHKTRMVG